MEYKRRYAMTRDKQKLKSKRKVVDGGGGVPALMHRPPAVEATPRPEHMGKCAHPASRPYSAAARALLS